MTEGEFKISAANADYVLLNDSFGLTHVLEQIAQRFDLQNIDFNALVTETGHEAEESSEMHLHLDTIPEAPSAEAQF